MKFIRNLCITWSHKIQHFNNENPGVSEASSSNILLNSHVCNSRHLMESLLDKIEVDVSDRIPFHPFLQFWQILKIYAKSLHWLEFFNLQGRLLSELSSRVTVSTVQNDLLFLVYKKSGMGEAFCNKKFWKRCIVLWKWITFQSFYMMKY